MDIAALIDRYDAAWSAQDLDAIASMHDDDIVFHNHTAGERVSTARRPSATTSARSSRAGRPCASSAARCAWARTSP